MKKRVVHIAQSYTGGVPEYLYTLIKHLNHNKYENILILSNEYSNQIERFKEKATEINLIDMERDINLKKDIKSTIEVKKILKRVKPDVVYLHSSKAGAFGRLALLFKRKIKIIYNAHGWFFNAEMSNKKKKIIALIERILAINTDMIVNISKNEYDSAIRYKIANKEKMCIIENGIDFNKFEHSQKYRKPTREKYNIKDSEVLVGVVGRIEEQKSPITTIKAAEQTIKQMKNVKFMFIGSGSLEETVKEYAIEKNIQDNIIFTGWVNRVEEYIPALDIAILPSKWEGFGLAIIEYMACKKPIIASKTGGIENIINDNENGFLITPGDYKKLSEYIIKYINNKELVEQMVELNYKYGIENYSIKNEIQKTEELLDM